MGLLNYLGLFVLVMICIGFLDTLADPEEGRRVLASCGVKSPSRLRSTYSQAIVFIVGPGNYLEYQSLQSESVAQPSPGLGGRRAVTYGCTEVQTATEFMSQLASLG